jgi:hypothetical protein
MVDWQITATTIYCDAVDDEVTLLVYKDGSAVCTGFKKFTEPTHETSHIVKRKERASGRTVKCRGAGCRQAEEYRAGLFSESSSEPKKPRSGNAQ